MKKIVDKNVIFEVNDQDKVTRVVTRKKVMVPEYKEGGRDFLTINQFWRHDHIYKGVSHEAKR